MKHLEAFISKSKGKNLNLGNIVYWHPHENAKPITDENIEDIIDLFQEYMDKWDIGELWINNHTTDVKMNMSDRLRYTRSFLGADSSGNSSRLQYNLWIECKDLSYIERIEFDKDMMRFSNRLNLFGYTTFNDIAVNEGKDYRIVIEKRNKLINETKTIKLAEININELKQIFLPWQQRWDENTEVKWIKKNSSTINLLISFKGKINIAKFKKDINKYQDRIKESKYIVSDEFDWPNYKITITR